MNGTMIVRAVEPLPMGKKRMRIRLEGGCDICLYSSEVRRLGIEEGTELSSDEYENIIHQILLPRAKSRALHLLEKQDRSRANLLSKLLEGYYPPDVANAAVDYVADYHYIDDDRYARNYIYFHKHEKSKRRIVTDLLRKGVEKEVIDRAIEEDYDTDEEDMIKRILEKKHYDPSNADPKVRGKMFRHLMSKGFGCDTIKQLI